MKKILFCLIATVLLTSCGRGAKKFKYDGHYYIQFYERGNYNSGIVHDPHCWCFKDSTYYERKSIQ